MEVIFKESVADKIRKAIDMAITAGKEIDCINLSNEEWQLLKREVAGLHSPLVAHLLCTEKYPDCDAVFSGVRLKIK